MIDKLTCDTTTSLTDSPNCAQWLYSRSQNVLQTGQSHSCYRTQQCLWSRDLQCTIYAKCRVTQKHVQITFCSTLKEQNGH